MAGVAMRSDSIGILDARCSMLVGRGDDLAYGL